MEKNYSSTHRVVKGKTVISEEDSVHGKSQAGICPFKHILHREMMRNWFLAAFCILLAMNKTGITLLPKQTVLHRGFEDLHVVKIPQVDTTLPFVKESNCKIKTV